MRLNIDYKSNTQILIFFVLHFPVAVLSNSTPLNPALGKISLSSRAAWLAQSIPGQPERYMIRLKRKESHFYWCSEFNLFALLSPVLTDLFAVAF